MINQQDAETFERDGVVVLRNVLDDAWLSRLAKAIEANMAAPGPHGKDHAETGGAYFGDYVNWQRFEDYLKVASEGPLGAVAAQLMSAARVQFFHEHVLVKEPGNSSATPWHQDMPYYCLEGDKTVSLWVPLDPVDEAESLNFLAGSHRGKRTYTPRRFKTLEPLEGDTTDYAEFPDIDAADPAIRSYAVNPGDVLAFDFHTLHDAPANPTDKRRRAVSFRFVGEGARYVERPHAVSPPFPEMGLKLAMNDPLPEEWFPTVWRAA
ncbi:MAG: phytanoyl-CoA dioxygenase family protein [Ahrensia sp.]|nr:phytanoyl-CoA dioxygenase family protein [Ahrensia sp.]